ncbi:sugar phosphate isomerase/epimerase [Puniceicoccales bacterium CK1056]|uniref:Sugar phosphate isomerase/epimerase n=1 Tax=Oceanipulchritudo coccoides TaxID=2706888 RepID=A0A6B2M073_9BACT|nr:sugar phosphate isomerase/epimerase family protein [Oceanipulchritudo coccoides]NDV61709.1 sugar phosphate isomerase/epimerase [Oceanipulchritudo coccoides]
MSAKTIEDLSKCAVHTITTKPWAIETAIDQYAKAGFGGITVWRDAMKGRDIDLVRQHIKDAGLKTAALVRGGFFCYGNPEDRMKAFADNRLAIREAETLGAPMVVLVCGARPGQSLEESRKQIREGIETVLPHAEASGVTLAIEPLHPMYADDRSAINTLRSANELAEYFNSDYVGIAVDVYHLWWDPDLEKEIKRCGKKGNLSAFHVCDWRTPTEDLLLDRGLMGEGCIDIPTIRGWVEAAGFDGFNEVEIFSKRRWESDQSEWLNDIKAAYLKHV